MIRYFVSFPVEARVTPEDLHQIQEYLKQKADAEDWQDVIVNMGGTITDLRPKLTFIMPRPAQHRQPRIIRGAHARRR